VSKPLLDNAALQANTVSVSFAGVAAVAGVDLQVDSAEVHALVGPNGSGKTTLLNAISGFARTQHGSLHTFGHDITRAAPNRRAALGIGRTFQSPMVIADVKVLDLLEIGLYLRDSRSFWASAFRPIWTERKSREFRRQAADALQQSGLEPELVDEDVSALSHGQLKMVDVARALLGQPRVLLLDEPAAGLDESETAILHDLILSLKATGVSVLVVEHNVQFVLNLVDRVTVLDQGKILAVGDPRATLARPEVVAAYLGPRAVHRAEPGEDKAAESARRSSP